MLNEHSVSEAMGLFWIAYGFFYSYRHYSKLYT